MSEEERIKINSDYHKRIQQGIEHLFDILRSPEDFWNALALVLQKKADYWRSNWEKEQSARYLEKLSEAVKKLPYK